MDSIIFKEGSVDLPQKSFSLPLINSIPYLEWDVPESVVKSLIAFDNHFLPNRIKNVNYDTNFAQYLTEELSPHLDPILKFDDKSPFDWQQLNPSEYNVWAYEGISPLFEYYNLGIHDRVPPHFDETTFIKDDPYIRTLMTGIIFLTDEDTGALTLLDDQTLGIPYNERTLDASGFYEDPKNILSWALPKKGKIVVFPSKLCHSILPYLSNDTYKFAQFNIFYNAMSKEEIK